ncbi:unnamed protein product [Soboliphyme baturini]|uniref:G_PROTEIN_RECEP_F2_3 domain-containing protein n=1 Tax=Soboliphyme baturini TaxID=241478 RepID=A0A183IYV4_9BILA|nr:unnamed protein product [Soboliphyme baturini]
MKPLLATLTTIALIVLSPDTVCRPTEAASEDCCGPNDPNYDTLFCKELRSLSDSQQASARERLGEICDYWANMGKLNRTRRFLTAHPFTGHIAIAKGPASRVFDPLSSFPLIL